MLRKKAKMPSSSPSPCITERKQVEEVLKELEAKFKTIVENIRDVVFQLSPLGIIQYVSPKVQEVYGYKPEDLIGKHFKKTTSISELAKVLDALKSVLSGKVINNLEINQLDSKGKIVPMEINVAPVRRQGKIIAVQGIMRDITERKRVERDLNERMKELQCLYGIAYIVERPGIALDELYQEVVNLLPVGWQYPEVTCARVTLGHKEFKTDNFKTTEWKQSANINVKGQKEGSIEVYYLEERPEFDEGTFLKQERLLIDVIAERLGRITERMQVEAELKSSEERLKILFEFAPDAYYLNDLKGNFIDGNKIAEEITGYKRDELIGKSFLKLKLLSLKQIPKATALLARNALGKATGPNEFILNRKDGNQVPVEIRTFPVKIKDKALVLGIARDITERKQAEEALKESEGKFRTFMETAGDLMHMADKDGNITYVNEATARTLGYSKEEMIGKHVTQFLSKEVLEKDFKPKWEELITKGEIALESTWVTKDGKEIYGEQKVVAIYDSDGRYLGSRAVFRDLTERKRMERELQERNEQLDAQNEELQSQTEELMTQQQELIEKTGEVEEANRLKSEFLANMSHELRTPLNVIIGFSELMVDKVPGEINEEQRKCLDDILGSSKLLLGLINEVLDLSKIESGKAKFRLANLALNEVIQSLARTMLPVLAPRQQSLDVEIEEGLPQVHADKAKVRQVLLNLLNNSIKFTPDGGKLKIEAVREDNWCRVSVIDNGIGIKEEDQERMFEPFCQLDNPLTQERGGTGLGLALVKQIIEKHGGQIWVESEYGRGSRFTFTLPLATAD